MPAKSVALKMWTACQLRGHSARAGQTRAVHRIRRARVHPKSPRRRQSTIHQAAQVIKKATHTRQLRVRREMDDKWNRKDLDTISASGDFPHRNLFGCHAERGEDVGETLVEGVHR